jgi:spore maturation protein CgeB
MKICLFYHSIVSDWNHGNAHFLRGIVSSLLKDGHRVIVFEPLNGWSLTNMIKDAGSKTVLNYQHRFPNHVYRFYDQKRFTSDPAFQELDDADLVIVHEWNSPELISEIGIHKKTKGKYILLFHDTHHRSLSDSKNMAGNDLSAYDGVLAFGEVIRQIYLKNKWAKSAWTWHEAADVNIFHPIQNPEQRKDLVWIGNWGDEERSEEIFEFIINPVRELGLKASFYGVRYPPSAIRALEKANIEYKGWTPNYDVPQIFSQYKVTVHVPRRLYTSTLEGIPTIRPFEAMACGIPLISSPWKDTEHLFRTNIDYLQVTNGKEMKEALKRVLDNPIFAKDLSDYGLQTILSHHTCNHRKEQLYRILKQINIPDPSLAFDKS